MKKALVLAIVISVIMFSGVVWPMGSVNITKPPPVVVTNPKPTEVTIGDLLTKYIEEQPVPKLGTEKLNKPGEPWNWQGTNQYALLKPLHLFTS